ncbi:MAG: TauD/TfdA family dioxygenase, partial [Chromatiales bacterium]|nr:TauD/TfdA family dioxygenase [Chromatiales bacterium]
VAFSRRFGTLETMLKGSVGTGSPFAGITNVDPQTDTILAPADHRMKRQYSNELWHTDSSFKKLSAWASLLYAKEVPPTGGNTHFAALRRAWVDLDDSMKAIVRKLAAEHDFVYSRSILNDDQFLSAQQKAEVPAVPQALVVRNPRTLLDSLYLGSHAAQIIGWPKAKGRELLDALTAHATQDKYIYTHQWEANQLVMWDDRATMHRGSAWDYQRYRRVMARTTVSAPTPTITEQEVEQARAHARSLIDVPLAV